jgi:hypothetical protein
MVTWYRSHHYLVISISRNLQHSVEKVTQTILSSKNAKLHFGMIGLTYKGIITIRVCKGLKVTDQL